jgi:hypothetical protein
MEEKDNLEHELIKSKQYTSLLQTQASEWRSQFEQVYDTHRTSVDQVERLARENQDLHAHCEDLLKLASTSLEAIQ